MKINLLSILLFAFFTLTNCKKENTSSSEILTAKTWKRALNDLNTSSNPSGSVIYYAVQNCEKDDTFKFGVDSKLEINKNSDKCDQNENQNSTQTYTLNRTTKEFIINGTKFTLAEESNNQIKYYEIVPSNTGFEYIIFLLQ
jgi:hypothetical protein